MHNLITSCRIKRKRIDRLSEADSEKVILKDP